MRKKSPPSEPTRQPTPAELAILRVLWQRGSATVREVMETLNESRPGPLAYTTVLSFLQIMTEKGHVTRAEGERGHIYSPATSAGHAKQQLIGHFLDRVFGGSVRELVIEALGSRKISRTELREIRKLLDELES